MTTIAKQVGYAYPTSDTACRFKRSGNGCYFVLFLANGRTRYRSNRDQGFGTLQEAFAYADKQPEPYDHYSLRPDGSTPWLIGIATK